MQSDKKKINSAIPPKARHDVDAALPVIIAQMKALAPAIALCARTDRAKRDELMKHNPTAAALLAPLVEVGIL